MTAFVVPVGVFTCQLQTNTVAHSTSLPPARCQADS